MKSIYIFGAVCSAVAKALVTTTENQMLWVCISVDIFFWK